MSCGTDQLSQDSGEGRGSTWTNYFISNGITPFGTNATFTSVGHNGDI